MGVLNLISEHDFLPTLIFSGIVYCIKNISKSGYIFWVSEVKGKISKITTFLFTLIVYFYSSYVCMFIGFPIIY